MNKRDEVYAQLERNMLQYTDYQNMPVQPSGEPMVMINPEDDRFRLSIREDAVAITGLAIYVRQGVKSRLEIAADELRSRLPGAQLDVGYGYRSNRVQEKRFEQVYEQLPDNLSDEEKLAAAHRQVAIPWLAGHPAGAAVDIAIAVDGVRRDFGTDMWDFSKESYTFAPIEDIGVAPRGNRMLLRTVMKNAGFAPFDGEWWHFSYGDKEWARYTGRDYAVYEQIDFEATDNN